VIVTPAKHQAQFANRGRTAAVAERALPHQFVGGHAQTVVGHHHPRHVRTDHPSRAGNTFFQGVMIGVQIQNHDVTGFLGEQAVDPILLRFEEELEFRTQG
jgi:hypothetical protein